MTKLTLQTISNNQNDASFLDTLNANFAAIVAAIENTVSRDGRAPNTMDGDLDLDSNRILNLPAPTTAFEPIRKTDLDAVAGDLNITDIQELVDEAQGSADASAGSAAAAALSAAAAAVSASQSAQGTVADDAVSTIKLQGGAVTNAKMANMVPQRLKGRKTSGAGSPEDLSLTEVLDWAGSDQGVILYRGASGWTTLPVGTAGDVLTTQGVSANPSWATLPTTSSVLPGTILQWASTRPPSGYFECNGQAINRASNPALSAVLRFSATVTMTIAAPCVITWSAHGLKAYDVVKFTTTGALPTGITASTTYYVSAIGLTANTFSISTTPGGAQITTTGSQSGTHTAIHAPWGDGDGSTTVNVPDLRGYFPRGWDNSAGVDTNRTYGSYEADMVGPHTHQYYTVDNRNTSSGGSEKIAYYNLSGNKTGLVNSGTETRPKNIAVMYIIKT